MNKKLFALYLFAALLLVLLVTVPAFSDEDSHFLYIGDEPWYNEASYPMVKIRQLYYIPVSAIERIEGITVRSNDALNNMLISYKDGKYISFDTASAQFAYTEERGQFFLQTYLMYGNERYIPAEEVAEYFGFTFELYKEGSAARLSDGNSKRSFEDLIAQYNPGLLGGDTADVTTYDPIVTPPDAPTATDDLYLIFIWENGYISDVLDLLKGTGICITVFADSEKLSANPDALYRIVSGGHEFGFIADSQTDAGELDIANEKIYGFIKRKTRLVYGYDLSEYGYLNCSGAHDALSSTVKTSSVVAQTALEGIKYNVNSKIVFDSSNLSVGALPEIIDYINKNPKYTARGLTAAVAVSE